MARNYVINLFTPRDGYFLHSEDDKSWAGFSDPQIRRSYGTPARYKRTLWSVTPTNDADGKYYGDAIIRGYGVTRKVLNNDDRRAG
jgi:hypothetical protein